MLRNFLSKLAWVFTLTLVFAAHPAAEDGRTIYLERCVWCHGETGRGDGPSADGMLPRPRDFVIADYKFRSTPHGQLPTDEDLFRMISRRMPSAPMPGWEKILSQEDRWKLVAYLKSLSPRFQSEKREALAVPTGSASVERGREVYRQAKCFLCHGEAGRGDGEITARLNFEWGLPFSARDLTRGWTFLGGHTPAEIYLRITGGLNGTPMGPYQDLLTEQERWDLAHYVASLDQEANETSEDFLIIAAFTRSKIPPQHEAAEWKKARPVQVPLAGQVVLNPPSRWWTPTVGSATVRALWNGEDLGLLVEWDDPTGPDSRWADSALVQFAASPELRPYFLLGQTDSPVKVWHWAAQTGAETWTVNGPDKLQAEVPGFKVASTWKDGRWHVLFQGAMANEPSLAVGRFVPTLFSIRDGANGERDHVRAISTWLYTTLEPPPSARPWLLALACVLATVIGQLWLISKLRS